MRPLLGGRAEKMADVPAKINTEFFISTCVDILERLLSQTCHLSVL